MVDVTEVEKRADLVKVSGIKIDVNLGGIQVASPRDLEMIADRLARGFVAVPVHCRDKPGVCFALCLQALEWRMPIMSVINKSYVVSNRGVERIAYESQLIHAVIERNAPIKSRLRYEIVGSGDDMRCKVWATFKGETKPHEYISQTLAKLRDARGKNEEGKVKGSPLWIDNPEVQLFYSASRQWARLFCPDVVLGAYTPDEFDADTKLVDVTPKIDEYAQRLRDAKMVHGEARGFDQASVTQIIEGEIDYAGQVRGREGDAGGAQRGGGAASQGTDDNDKAARETAGKRDNRTVAQPPGKSPKGGETSVSDKTTPPHKTTK